jgi:predicted AAA+ superfamily ATPase
MSVFERPLVARLLERLAGHRRFVQVLAGPRQVGKTTAVLQARARLEATGVPVHYATGDEPLLPAAVWIDEQWQVARSVTSPTEPAVLVLDEVHRIPGWAERVKANWDRDTRETRDLHVVLLGSSPLQVRQRVEEALTGRFETLPATHWSYPECRDAFGWDVDTYLFHGGYPGAAPLIDDFARWRGYVLDSIVEPTVSRDVLSVGRVDKPALLRQLFYLACDYSGQVIAYTKLLGQLQDAGNTTTLAEYLRRLGDAWLVTGLQKYSGGALRRRASSPKLQVLNTALLSAVKGLRFEEARADGEHWGRLTESAVGAHLAAAAAGDRLKQLYYWREGGLEVDYVVEASGSLTAIEVKSGRRRKDDTAGMAAFSARFAPRDSVVVGPGGVPLEDFLQGASA